MPKVHEKRARKDYPHEGIKKGDIYWSAKFKTGPASGVLKRWSTKPLPSQLTLSAYRSGSLSVGEEWERSSKDADAIREAETAVRELGEEARASFDNMPEGLQQGDTGQMLENRADECDRIADELESLASDMEGLTEPEEMDEVEEPDDDADSGAWEEYEKWQEWQAEADEYASELARIPEEVENLLGDMPE